MAPRSKPEKLTAAVQVQLGMEGKFQEGNCKGRGRRVSYGPNLETDNALEECIFMLGENLP